MWSEAMAPMVTDENFGGRSKSIAIYLEEGFTKKFIPLVLSFQIYGNILTCQVELGFFLSILDLEYFLF